MRTALISCLETLPDGGRRGFARLGGRTLLSWQIDLARDLGCERIVCLTDAKVEAFTKLQEQVQGFGGEFHTISGPLPLSTLLSADQELVVIADGLIADRAQAKQLLTSQRGVLALPDQVGLDAGFERIDAENAWAGIFVARGQIGEQLAQMPSDSDTVSLLLRLALQSGVKLVPLDASQVESGDWMLLRAVSELTEREDLLLESSTERTSWWGPTKAATSRIIRNLAPRGLERGPLVAGAVAFLSGAGALLSGYYQAPFAFALLALAVAALETRLGLLRLKSRLRGAEPAISANSLKILIDITIVALLAWPYILAGSYEIAAVPMIMILAMRAAVSHLPTSLTELLNDRAILSAGLMLAIITEQQLAVSVAISLFSLILSLFFQQKTQITSA